MEKRAAFQNLKGLTFRSGSLAETTGMMKLDPTLKHIGLVLRRRLSDAPPADASHRIADLMERLSRAGQSDAPSRDSNTTPSPK